MILFLCDTDQDYAADYLYDGCCSMLGASAVVDWPTKPSLHAGEQRQFDCDLAWPDERWDDDEVFDLLAARRFDLIIIPTLRGLVPQRVMALRARGLLAPYAGKIIGVDGEDHPTARRLYDEIVGTPVRYFCREMPLSVPTDLREVLPFGYPARRIHAPVSLRAPKVFASWQVWGWSVGGMRDRLAAALAALDVPKHVQCWSDAQYGAARYVPAEYHRIARSCSVGVAPAGAGYFTNRLFELVADGCAVVAERPTVHFPNGFRDGLEIAYFDTVEEAVALVQGLLDDPDRARRMAQCAQRQLLDHHTTRCRAEQVWRSVHGG